MKIPEEIQKKLPENFEDDWAPIKPEDIQLNDYICYYAKPRKYQSGKESEGGLKKGGFITFLPNEEESAIKGHKDKVFGFRQYAVKWSVNQDNVSMFFKTKKDVEEILAKGKKKAKETKEERRINKVEVETEKLQNEIKEAKKLEKSKKRKSPEPAPVVEAVVEAVVATEPPPPEKRKRGRPSKK